MNASLWLAAALSRAARQSCRKDDTRQEVRAKQDLLKKLSADAQKLQKEVAVYEQDLTTIHVPLFSLIMRPPSYWQRLFVEYDLGESSGSTVDVVRRAGHPWLEQMARKMLRNVEKRGIQAARNGPDSLATRHCLQIH